jgi:hypothetical protein
MRGKAIIERTFDSINTLFCQHVAGYTGRDVTRRGTADELQALWSMADLQELLDEWVLAGWQARPHEGLRHPFSPDKPCSPNDAYAALVSAAGYIPVALTGEDYIELMPAEWRVINDDGVHIDYRTYICDEIRPFRHLPSGVAGKGNQWEIHYDPYDVSRIWVRNHHDTKHLPTWIPVPWTHHKMVMQPFADFTWRHARKIARERRIDDTNERAVAGVLDALLSKAEHGPESRQVMGRARAAAALPPTVPREALPPGSPEPAALPEAQELAPVEEEADQDSRAPRKPVAGFGLFNPFGQEEGGYR